MHPTRRMLLHLHIDERSVEGDEATRRVDKPLGCKKEGRGIKQLQKPIFSKHEVSIS